MKFDHRTERRKNSVGWGIETLLKAQTGLQVSRSRFSAYTFYFGRILVYLKFQIF